MAECLVEGDDVFQTCVNAECAAPAASEATDEHQGSEEAAAPVEEPKSCREMCQDLDDKVYLMCVSEHDADVISCRNRKGVVFENCLQSHCGETAGE